MELLERVAREEAAVRQEMEAKLTATRRPLIESLAELQHKAWLNGSAAQAEALQRTLRDLQLAPQGARSTIPNPGVLTAYRGQVGRSYLFVVTGKTDGVIWGSGVYSDDSALATAAVHAGALRAGQTGVVHVTIQPGQSSYDASSQNGVTSNAYGHWAGSYSLRADVSWRPAGTINWQPQGPDAPPPVPPVSSSTDIDRVRMDLPAGTSYTVAVTGSSRGIIWGNGVYTTDSSLATAAVHCGALHDGERGTVTVTILPGQTNYEAGTRNGIPSDAWGAWPGSFTVQKTSPKSDGSYTRTRD